MALLISTASILIITLIVWVLNRWLPFKVCPICAGVSSTWIWMLVALFYNFEPFNYAIDPIVPATMIGGSVVGIAYQIEKRLPQGRSSLLWKSLFIPTGFIAAYSLVGFLPIVFLTALGVLAILALVFLKKSYHTKAGHSQAAKELEKKMDECC